MIRFGIAESLTLHLNGFSSSDRYSDLSESSMSQQSSRRMREKCDGPRLYVLSSVQHSLTYNNQRRFLQWRLHAMISLSIRNEGCRRRHLSILRTKPASMS